MVDKQEKEIDAGAKTISALLDKMKYGIDYYQREYRWETKQISELLADLEEKFNRSYEEGHPRTQVENYAHYFLGSIVISRNGAQRFLVDGQQRLTSLTLLLIYLHHLRPERDTDIRTLIFSEKYGKNSYNLDVPERVDCLNALYAGQPFDATDQPESVQNIVGRYHDIEEQFPESLKDQRLDYFIDWLLYNVDLVEIIADSDDAYTIFETMNDRGLSLTPTDMLKGYLLANIVDPQEKQSAADVWKQRLLQLIEVGKEEESDFFKAWLRAKYALTIREGKKGATNKDFEKIGTTFHKWVRDEKNHIGLVTSEAFRDFIKERFARFSRHYLRMRQVSLTWTPGFEDVYFNTHHNFTLQYPLMLAPLLHTDDQETVERKMRLVAIYIDIFIARRVVNYRTLGYSSIVYTMFNLIKDIRDLSVDQLAQTLKAKVAEMQETFAGVASFGLHQQNGHYVHHMLARMTYHIEQQSGVASSFVDYISREIKKPFEIEHLWSNHYRQHLDEFSSEELFAQYRNRFGALVLLPRGFNQSFNDAPYEQKVKAYFGQNLLARSLNEQCYQNNPSFLAYLQQSGLPFKPHAEFKKADLETRQELYQRLCEEIWSPARFDKVLQG